MSTRLERRQCPRAAEARVGNARERAIPGQIEMTSCPVPGTGGRRIRPAQVFGRTSGGENLQPTPRPSARPRNRAPRRPAPCPGLPRSRALPGRPFTCPNWPAPLHTRRLRRQFGRGSATEKTQRVALHRLSDKETPNFTLNGRNRLGPEVGRGHCVIGSQKKHLIFFIFFVP